jgi:hypothetical protein
MRLKTSFDEVAMSIRCASRQLQFKSIWTHKRFADGTETN